MRKQIRLWTLLATLALGGVVAVCGAVAQNRPAPPPSRQDSFAQLISELSEPGGYFDTDNLISNEKSYLHVIPQLEQRGVRGGVYIGVGPDQNFSYIARVRPQVAFIVDIRRDNLLLHLLFKALFEISRNRVEYLGLLTGRAVPTEMENWREASVDQLVAHIDHARPVPAAALDRRIRQTIAAFGVPLSAEDYETILKYHAAFIESGLALQFQTFGRPIQSYNPTYGELLAETDRRGRKLSFLASEPDFQFVRDMQSNDKIIPVVGDFAGTHALPAIAGWMAGHGERLSAFYVSNVEDYLFRGGSFGRYIENLKQLPHQEQSLVIRSVFGRLAERESAPGYYSASTVQSLDELLSGYAVGKYRSYRTLLGQ